MKFNRKNISMINGLGIVRHFVNWNKVCLAITDISFRESRTSREMPVTRIIKEIVYMKVSISNNGLPVLKRV